jgi:FixJ family two-component response regulator
MPSNPVVHVIDDDDAARDSLAFLLRAAQVDVRTYETAPPFWLPSNRCCQDASSPTCECRK